MIAAPNGRTFIGWDPNREYRIRKWATALDPKNKADFFKLSKAKYERCLDPSMSCTKKAIRAHSVQNATALSHIAENNHVYEMKLKIKNERPVIEMKLVGRNHASTFTGLCAEHDNAIFKPIDEGELDERDREQLFLIAYRSVTRELHAANEVAMKIQSTYLRLADRGDVPKDAPSTPGVNAVQHMLKAWAVWKYRYNFFDNLLITRKFNGIRHLKFALEGKPPVIASSSFFSMDFKPWGKPFAALIVNLIPTSSDRTLVLFSYSKKHAQKAAKFLKNLLILNGTKKEYELSCLLLDRAENFFLSPQAVKSWSPEKRIEIENAFSQDLLGPNPLSNAPLVRTPLLNLFDVADM